MCVKFIFVIITSVLCIGVHSAKLPEDIKKCKRTDPNLGECVRLNVMDALIKMKNGVSTLGIPVLDPLHIAAFEIGSSEGPVNLKQSFKDISLIGVVDNTISKYEPDLEKYRLYSEADNPLLQLLGDYEMNGRVLVLPVQGKGKCNITMVDVKTTHDIRGEPFQKKGKTYWRITDYKFTMKPKRAYLNFGNLFNGNQVLGESTNRFLNENWEVLFGELTPGYEETFGIIFKDLANRIFQRVPIKDIFID